MDSLLISPSLPWLLTSDSVSPPTLTVSPSNTLYMYVSSPSSWVNRQNVSDGAPQLMSPSSDLWKKQMFNLLNFLKNLKKKKNVLTIVILDYFLKEMNMSYKFHLITGAYLGNIWCSSSLWGIWGISGLKKINNENVHVYRSKTIVRAFWMLIAYVHFKVIQCLVLWTFLRVEKFLFERDIEILCSSHCLFIIIVTFIGLR